MNAKKSIEPQLLSIEQTARFLGLGRSSIYELVQAGYLVPVQVPRVRRVLFDADDLHRFVDRAKQEKAKETTP